MSERPNHSVLKVTQVGNSLRVVRPREILSELNLDKGDKLYLTRSPDGYRVNKSDPKFEQQMSVARFIDGNKRTAFVAMELFLELNGFGLAASDEDALMAMLRLASGDMDGDEFAVWVGANCRRR